MPNPILKPALVSLLLVLSAPASAQQGWTAMEGEAGALLPAPDGNADIVAGKLACAEQQWRLFLGLAEGSPAISGPVTLAIDGAAYPAAARSKNGEVAVSVPFEAVDHLKSGIRLAVRLTLAGEDSVFSLRGSRRAIEAAAPLCTPRNMSAYQQVVMSPASTLLALASRLRDADLNAFRMATASEPDLSAGALEIGADKRIVFAEICGSSWYFGRSGCNLAGFVAENGTEEWQQVFDAEGARLYADKTNAVGIWPNLIALPLNASGPDMIWRWNGERYALAGTQLEPPE